jgi:hypothetical protein
VLARHNLSNDPDQAMERNGGSPAPDLDFDEEFCEYPVQNELSSVSRQVPVDASSSGRSDPWLNDPPLCDDARSSSCWDMSALGLQEPLPDQQTIDEL